ncbi:MAG: [FeFe] hydrogenase H-cluster radical SAM maturase HydE [Bacteroidales bacterium]|nr:[FeFe] hydrogenase H-cluster radical SAM maturase HydE [Bacteroidales bacterium]
MKNLIDKLASEKFLSKEEFERLITNFDADTLSYANQKACEVRKAVYGNSVYIRGLIEVSNYCKNDCLYCGIRVSNRNAERYRLTKEEILQCCEEGYGIGFRTFVMQGGEDLHYSDEDIVEIVKAIKAKFPDCAVTLSIGEKSFDTYKKYRDAGADRYLLRHETANESHYGKLHPEKMSFRNRMECLENLKKLGFQTGCGFMVGSPYQTSATIYEDLKFLREFKPAMVGIGPFIPHHETPFKDQKQGSVELTLLLLSIIRLMLPEVLLPSTTALGTAGADGRERGILAGANVIMPNLSPVSVRRKYMIYDNKLVSGEEAAENLQKLKLQMEKIGYEVVCSRGDSKM